MKQWKMKQRRKDSIITCYRLCYAFYNWYLSSKVSKLRKQSIFKSIRRRALKHSLISVITFETVAIIENTNLALSGQHRKLSRPVKTYLGLCIIDLFSRRVSGSAVIVWHSKYAGGPDSDRVAASYKRWSSDDRDHFVEGCLSVYFFSSFKIP